MLGLESISATGNRDDYLVRFRRSDGGILDITVTLGPGRAALAHPDFLAAGKWRDVSDVTERIVPAVEAFAKARAVAIDDD